MRVSSGTVRYLTQSDASIATCIFRKRATNYRALLRKMTYKGKASYGSDIVRYLTQSDVSIATCSVLQCVAVFVAVCCSVLQCVAVCVAE